MLPHPATQVPLVFLHPPGSQQLVCSLGLACHVTSPVCDVLMFPVPAELTAEPRRENWGSQEACVTSRESPLWLNVPSVKRNGLDIP